LPGIGYTPLKEPAKKYVEIPTPTVHVPVVVFRMEIAVKTTMNIVTVIVSRIINRII
jgi:hypothetical protein